MKIKKRSEFPKCIRHFKQLKGICVGECVERDSTIDKRHVAHAHCVKDKLQGWICLRYKYQLKEKLTLLHEVAHLIANMSEKTPPHGKKWKDTVIKIGGTFKSFSYKHNGVTRTNIDYTYRNNMW